MTEREPDNSHVKTAPNVALPPYIPATPEEIARRRALAKDLDLRRAAMPAIRDAAELVRETREEHEDENG